MGIDVEPLVTALEKDGFALLKGTRGSHLVYLHSDGRRVVIPYHKRSDTLPLSTLRTFLQATQWNQEDAIALNLLRHP